MPGPVSRTSNFRRFHSHCLEDILTGKAFAGDLHDNLALFRKFEGIAYNVNQDLAQSRRVVLVLPDFEKDRLPETIIPGP
jgi:hypothetical protein